MATKSFILTFAALTTAAVAGTIDSGSVTVTGTAVPRFVTAIGSSEGDYQFFGTSESWVLTWNSAKIGTLIEPRAGNVFDSESGLFVVGGVPQVALLKRPGGISMIVGRNSQLYLQSEPFVLSSALVQTARFYILPPSNLFGTIDGTVPQEVLTDIGLQGTGTVTFEFRRSILDDMEHARSTWVFDTPEPTTIATTLGALALFAWRRRRACSTWNNLG